MTTTIYSMYDIALVMIRILKHNRNGVGVIDRDTIVSEVSYAVGVFEDGISEEQSQNEYSQVCELVTNIIVNLAINSVITDFDDQVVTELIVTGESLGMYDLTMKIHPYWETNLWRLKDVFSCLVDKDHLLNWKSDFYNFLCESEKENYDHYQ